MKLVVIKKDGSTQPFDENKVVNAVSKSAERVMYTFSNEEIHKIKTESKRLAQNKADLTDGEITINSMHSIVESILDDISPAVAKSYKEYRNYKVDFCEMLDSVYRKSQSIRYIGDVSNANTDSSMVSTQRSLIYGQLNKKLYKKFFLNKEEIQAANDGYIYIHDMKDRLDGINCCLCDVANVIRNGFEMGNVRYTEPKTLHVAFDVISDVVMSAASQQYGGFTIPRVDSILAPYAEKSYKKYKDEFIKVLKTAGSKIDINSIKDKIDKYAAKKVYRDFEQGFQSWEMVFNTVGSSRGDYPFISMSFGVDTSRWGVMASIAALRVRKGGQGKPGYKKAVLFPKLTFLYDKNLHGEGAPYEYMFDEAIECNKKAMYPDYLSLTGEGYIPSMYKKYGQVVSLMGCRASLSPWYAKGGMHPADENDYPVFEGRCNLGAISLHLSMILQKSRQECKDFYKVLDYYLELIRKLHKKTFDFLSEKPASTNPIQFMQGGFLGGNLKADEKIGKILRPMTMSFGITGLNELQMLYNGKSIYEDGEFALEVMKYINDKVNKFKEEDNILYAIYGTPAESLAGLQIEQFRAKYGIINGVSSREYVSNSFHCGVWENITPIEKQDSERRFWNLFNGGKIQYCKYPINYNTKAMKTLIRRGMEFGFYEGVNEQLSYCDDCGHEELNMTDKCPCCGSENLTIEDRMNGYIGYTKVKGKPRFNKAKLIEIKERVSM